MIPTIMDRINFFSDIPSLRRGAFQIIDTMQSEKNHAVQYLSPAVAFVAMAEALGRDPHEDIIRVRRMLADLEAAYTDQVQAIRDYAKGEFVNRGFN